MLHGVPAVCLKNSIQDTVEGLKYQDKWEIAKGGGRIILVAC